MASEPSASSSKPSSGDCFDAHDAAELRTEVGNVQLKRVAIQLPIVLTSAVAGGGLKGVNALGSIEIMIAAHAGNRAALLKEAGDDRTDAAGVVVAERLKEERRTQSMMVKMAALRPMPTGRVSTVAAVKEPERRSSAFLLSFLKGGVTRKVNGSNRASNLAPA